MRKTDHIRKGVLIRIIVVLLSLSGVNVACGSLDEEGSSQSGSAMNSSPMVVYTINGRVVTVEGLPLERIQIELPVLSETDGTVERTDTVYTDKEGQFVMSRISSPKEQTFKIIANDVFHPENKTFYETDTTVVTFSMNDLYNAGIRGSWDSGKVEKTISIILKKRELIQ